MVALMDRRRNSLAQFIVGTIIMISLIFLVVAMILYVIPATEDLRVMRAQARLKSTNKDAAEATAELLLRQSAAIDDQKLTLDAQTQLMTDQKKSIDAQAATLGKLQTTLGDTQVQVQNSRSEIDKLNAALDSHAKSSTVSPESPTDLTPR